MGGLGMIYQHNIKPVVKREEAKVPQKPMSKQSKKKSAKTENKN